MSSIVSKRCSFITDLKFGKKNSREPGLASREAGGETWSDLWNKIGQLTRLNEPWLSIHNSGFILRNRYKRLTFWPWGKKYKCIKIENNCEGRLDTGSRLSCFFWAWISFVNPLWWLNLYVLAVNQALIIRYYLLHECNVFVVLLKELQATVHFSFGHKTRSKLCCNSTKCHSTVLSRSQPLLQVLWETDGSLYAPDIWFSESKCHYLRSRAFLVV